MSEHVRTFASSPMFTKVSESLPTHTQQCMEYMLTLTPKPPQCRRGLRKCFPVLRQSYRTWCFFTGLIGRPRLRHRPACVSCGGKVSGHPGGSVAALVRRSEEKDVHVFSLKKDISKGEPKQLKPVLATPHLPLKEAFAEAHPWWAKTLKLGICSTMFNVSTGAQVYAVFSLFGPDELGIVTFAP